MDTLELKKFCLDKAIVVAGAPQEIKTLAYDFFEFMNQDTLNISEKECAPVELDKTAKISKQSALPKTNTKTPMPEVKPPKQNNKTADVKLVKQPLKKPSPGQTVVLEKIMLLNKQKQTTTASNIARHLDTEIPNIQGALKSLLGKSYIEITKKDGMSSKIYIAILDPSGNEIAPKLVKDEETGITHCPPAYAAGFGMKEPSIG